MAQISLFTRRTGQSTLETATLSSPSDDGGAHLRSHTRRGCNKLVRIKLLVGNTFGDKTQSILPTNCFIKAVKDEKMTKLTIRTADVVVAIIAAV
jgi:hypothetical protein